MTDIIFSKIVFSTMQIRHFLRFYKKNANGDFTYSIRRFLPLSFYRYGRPAVFVQLLVLKRRIFSEIYLFSHYFTRQKIVFPCILILFVDPLLTTCPFFRAPHSYNSINYDSRICNIL